jgi:NAD(P)-dependent dehydrogenase (short-subunit alcohol dehydrogenase family)
MNGDQALAGVVALVSGGSRGIGLAIAREFLRRGARVAITARKQEALDAAVKALKEAGLGAVLGVAAHSAKEAEVAAAFDAAERAWGPVQVTVNCAATNPSMAGLGEIDLEAFGKTLDTNVRGYLVVAREALARLRRGGLTGSIINVSSVAASRPIAGLGAYGVSKAAVDMLTRSLAVEAGKLGVRVNGIAPGVVRTRFSEALWKDPRAEASFAAKVPLGRIAEPEDIAGAAVFLASPASSYVTGQTLVVDGGLSIV